MEKTTIAHRAKKFYDSSKVRKLRRFDHPTVKAHVIDKVNYIKKTIKLIPKTTVLELGAGNGYFSFYFNSSCDLLATDINREILSLNPVKKRMVCDAKKLPFKDESFDIVMCFDVLHHVDNPDHVIKEAKRVSRRHVVLVEPNGDNIIQKLIFLPVPREWGLYNFSTKYLIGLIKDNSLGILRFKHIGRLITPNIRLIDKFIKLFPYSESPQLNFHNLVICSKELSNENS